MDTDTKIIITILMILIAGIFFFLGNMHGIACYEVYLESNLNLTRNEFIGEYC